MESFISELEKVFVQFFEKKMKTLLFKVILRAISQECVRVGDESNIDIGFLLLLHQNQEKMDKRQG